MASQQPIKRNLIIPEDALDDFATLILLSDDKLDAIYRRISHGLYSLDKMTIDVINETGLNDDDAFSSMTVICYLNSAAEERELSPEVIMEEVRLKFLESSIDAKRKEEVLRALESHGPRLARLISKEVRFPIEERKKRLAKAPYNPAVDFRTICDIRPVFDEPADRIESKMMVTLLDIIYENEDGDDKHMVFTMDEKAFGKLEAVIARTKKKMALLDRVDLTVK